MIQIIAGEKGKGKTKVLIEKANTEVRAAKGSVVYLDKSNKHMYELSNRIRLINVRDYFIENQSEFLGFVSGIISSNHDLQCIFFDSFLKIAYINEDNMNDAIDKLEKLSEQFNVDFIICISKNFDELPDSAKKNVLVSL